jgi:uncharacterized protein RhaS with RHS repeats
MGRVTASSQQIGNGTAYAFTYKCDLSGALASVQYPSGRTVTNAFDAAGRVFGVSGAMGTATSSNASSISYAPASEKLSRQSRNVLFPAK